MSWTVFLQTLGERQEHALTPHELEVILCLNEEPGQSKQQLLEVYQRRQGPIEEEAFTQRLRTIYRKFNVSGRGYKLPQLQRYLAQQYQQSGPGLSRFGLSRIHAAFPTDTFAAALERLLQNQEQAKDDDHKVDDPPVENHKEVAILQTFAPNLEHYRTHLSRCLQAGVRVRILLAWPYSLAAVLREEVLKRYAAEPLAEDFAIQGSVIANLKILEATIRVSRNPTNLEIRLYDTLPSLALYRAGSTLLAEPASNQQSTGQGREACRHGVGWCPCDQRAVWNRSLISGRMSFGSPRYTALSRMAAMSRSSSSFTSP